jgi:acyl-CoA synthetase (AMP-forming)/AMP-acid ligase II
VIIRGGFNVYPAEVEAAIGRDPGVAKCAVVGRRADGDEEIVAFIEPVPGRRIDAEALRRSLRTQLAPYKIPSRIVCMGKLPASGTGKLLRASLKHLARAEPVEEPSYEKESAHETRLRDHRVLPPALCPWRSVTSASQQ